MKPNMVECFAEGAGLATAPSVQPPLYDFEMDEQLRSGVNVTVEARNDIATAVTPAIYILGLMDNGQ
jgi:hypothetical protein